MKGKRGFLLGEETLKIVIAVICIIFLVYFLTSLYFANRNKKDLELAKASLTHLINETDNKNTQVEIYNPRGWSVCSFPQTIKRKLITSPEEVIPKQCSNLGWDNCLCIRKIGLYSDIDKQCDKNGYCLESDFTIEGEKLYEWQKTIDSITISAEPPLILTIDYGNKTIGKK